MKLIFLALLFLGATCMNAQSINKEITNSGKPYLLGKIDKEGLTSANYNGWFTKNFDNYEPDQTIINAIADNLKNYEIKLFMGTWCGDSKREVPRFYKILELAGFPMDQLVVIAVGKDANMYKQSPQHEEKGLNIHRVPTFIFYKDGKEVNRIVEKPVESLEKDIQKIINTNDYKSNYQIVTAVDEILKDKGVKGMKRKQKQLMKTYHNEVSSMFELNTYGRILYSTEKIDEAIAVFEFNTKLFPNNPRTYMSLANTLGISGYKERAIEVLEKAMEIHPENKDLEENLELVKSN